MQLKRLAPTYTWQTGSGTIFQDIVSGSRYLFYAPVVVVVAVSLEIRLIEFRYLCTRIMESSSSSSSSSSSLLLLLHLLLANARIL